MALHNTSKRAEEDTRDYVYRVLLFNIKNLHLMPCTKLSEGEIAQQLGVSRTPVHDTFAQLAREGLLQVEARRGTFVTKLCPQRIEESLWAGPITTIGILETLYTIRPKEKQLQGLQAIVNRWATALKKADCYALAALYEEFYTVLYTMAGWAPVQQFLSSISADVYRLLLLEETMDFWLASAEWQSQIYEGLLHHHHETARDAVLLQQQKIAEIFTQKQQSHAALFGPAGQ